MRLRQAAAHSFRRSICRACRQARRQNSRRRAQRHGHKLPRRALLRRQHRFHPAAQQPGRACKSTGQPGGAHIGGGAQHCSAIFLALRAVQPPRHRTVTAELAGLAHHTPQQPRGRIEPMYNTHSLRRQLVHKMPPAQMHAFMSQSVLQRFTRGPVRGQVNARAQHSYRNRRCQGAACIQPHAPGKATGLCGMCHAPPHCGVLHRARFTRQMTCETPVFRPQSQRRTQYSCQPKRRDQPPQHGYMFLRRSAKQLVRRRGQFRHNEQRFRCSRLGRQNRPHRALHRLRGSIPRAGHRKHGKRQHKQTQCRR